MSHSFLTAKPENIFYLTGFWGSFGFYLEHNDKKYLITDGRYTGKASELMKERAGIELVIFDTKFVEIFGENFSGDFQCENSLTLAQLANFKKWFPEINFIPTPGLIEAQRQIKSEAEIKKITQAQAHVDQVLIPFLQKNLKSGISEKTLQFHLENTLKAENKYGLSFDPIVAFGENSAIPHHEPSERTLKLGDNILIDCGVTLDRYCSDVTRNFVFGEPSKKYLEKYAKLLNIQNQVLKNYTDKISVKELDQTVRDLMGDDSQFYTHSLGHGVGIEVHESPRISTKSSETLEANQVVTCEPGLYYPGEFGIRIEDLLVIRNQEPDILSKITKDLISFNEVGDIHVLIKDS